MQPRSPYGRTALSLLIWTGLSAAFFVADRLIGLQPLDDGAGYSPLFLAGLVTAFMAAPSLLKLLTMWVFSLTNRPVVEGMMVGRVYVLLGIVGVAFSLAHGLGKLEDFSKFFAMFGGMLLGFSLQAPVSGFAAWLLVSLKRPFRPGDRVQFPNLALTGDVKDIGVMYTVLDQVGGTIGSEEAVGRFILVPNAMLFSQVAINYTVTQEQSYILDEVVVRITFNSDWEEAERILIEAATEMTGASIGSTGMKPYIRSDLYDYGVYLRLRYHTPVKDRAELAYKISKRIFMEIQRSSTVDLAIPFVYSARVGARGGAGGQRDDGPAATPDKESKDIQDIAIEQIHSDGPAGDLDVIDQLAQSIAANGLLQPIVVLKNPQGSYDIVAGQLRLAACKRLGWKKISAVVKGGRNGHEPVSPRLTMEFHDRSGSGV